jgi:hypothetical protein
MPSGSQRVLTLNPANHARPGTWGKTIRHSLAFGIVPIRVAKRLAERTVRRRAGQQFIDPGFELLQDRLGLLLA